MSQRTLLIVGISLLIAGCLAAGYISLAVANTHIQAIFSTMVTDVPAARFASLASW